MRLQVTVVALDDERRMKSTRVGEQTVSQVTIRLNESVLGRDPDAVLDMVADNALSAALRTAAQTGHQAAQGTLNEALAEARRAPRRPAEHGPPGAAPASAAAGNGLMEMLGLDLIDHQDQLDAAQTPMGGPQAPRGQGPAAPPPPGFERFREG